MTFFYPEANSALSEIRHCVRFDCLLHLKYFHRIAAKFCCNFLFLHPESSSTILQKSGRSLNNPRRISYFLYFPPFFIFCIFLFYGGEIDDCHRSCVNETVELFAGWFGTRKDFCQFLFMDACPCLQEYGNISYKIQFTDRHTRSQSSAPIIDQPDSAGSSTATSSSSRSSTSSTKDAGASLTGPAHLIDMPD